MSNFFPKLGLGFFLSIISFIPAVGIVVIFGLPSVCIWIILISIILFTVSRSDQETITLMDSFGNHTVSERKQCSFCGEEHNDEDCYYMGIDDLTGGGVL